MMDSTFAQEQNDCELEGMSEYPDFAGVDPSLLDITKHEKMVYRSIDLYDDEDLERMTMQLDKEQRMVLDLGVDFAKSVVKSKNTRNFSKPAPVLLSVQGGAGVG